MKKHNQQFVDKLLLIIMSIQTILLGALFIVQICRIYFGNDGNFTREICIKYIREIAIVIILWVLLIVGTGVYFVIKNQNKEKGVKASNVARLEMLLSIAPEFKNEELKDSYKELDRDTKVIKITKIVSLVIVVICALMGIGYLSNSKHFDSSGDLNAQIKAMTIHLMPWVIISFVSILFTSFYEEYRAKKMIEVVKMIIKNDGKKPYQYQKNNNKLVINIARSVIILIAVALIIVGSFDGSAKDMLQKAINICTECIGLG